MNETKTAVEAAGSSGANLAADLATFGILLGEPEAQRAIAETLVLSRNQRLGLSKLGMNADLTELVI